MTRRGIGQEDRMHMQFGQLIRQYQFYNKLKNCPIATYMPFGEKRTLATGALLKKKGAARGIPDWLFVKDKKGSAEFIWLEFKAPKGKQSDEQFNFQVTCEHLKNMTYYLPRSVEEAVKILEQEQILITD